MDYSEAMNEQPNHEQVKAQLAAEIVRLIGEHKLSDAAASKLIGLEAPEIAQLRTDELGEFSIDRLINSPEQI
jgi:predicted XRE-type DNA-binding protein